MTIHLIAHNNDDYGDNFFVKPNKKEQAGYGRPVSYSDVCIEELEHFEACYGPDEMSKFAKYKMKQFQVLADTTGCEESMHYFNAYAIAYNTLLQKKHIANKLNGLWQKESDPRKS